MRQLPDSLGKQPKTAHIYRRVPAVGHEAAESTNFSEHEYSAENGNRCEQYTGDETFGVSA